MLKPRVFFLNECAYDHAIGSDSFCSNVQEIVFSHLDKVHVSFPLMLFFFSKCTHALEKL